MKPCQNCSYLHPEKLSKRESEIINALLLGIPRKRLIDQLGITIKTINSYVSRAEKKMGVNDMVGVYRKMLTSLMIAAPDMDKSPDFRAGYSAALSDALNPDTGLFIEDMK